MKQLFTIIAAIVIISLLTVPHSFASDTCYTKEGYLFAVTEQDFNTCSSLLAEKDYAALQSATDAKRCGMLKGNIEVFLVKVRFFGGVQIRPKGHIATVWTNVEAIVCK